MTAVAGCSSGGSAQDDGVPADYKAVSDRDLFAAVESLPAVQTSDLRYVDQLGETSTYRGTVRLDPEAGSQQVTDVYDQVLEILRHGRYDAAYVVKVASGQASSGRADLDLLTPGDFDRRYGPQTGQRGWPPEVVRDGS